MTAKTTVRRLRKGMVLILFAAVVMTVCVSYRPVYIAERRRMDNARLFAAVRGGDTAAVHSLLNGFADANAHDLPADNRTLRRPIPRCPRPPSRPASPVRMHSYRKHWCPTRN